MSHTARMPVRRWGAILGAVLLVLTLAAMWSSRQAVVGEAKSALRRTILAANNPTPLAYWPLEDGEDSSYAAAATSRTGPLRVVAATSVTGDTVDFSSSTLVVGSAPLPVLNSNSKLVGRVPTTSVTDKWAVSFVGGFPDGTNQSNIQVNTVQRSDGTWLNLQFLFVPDDIGGPQIQASWLTMTDTGFTQAGSITVFEPDWFDGGPHHLLLTAEQDGSDIDYSLYLDGDLADSDTITSDTLARLDTVQVTGPIQGSGTYGHLVIYNTLTDLPDIEWASRGYVGETTAVRLARLADEEGITIDVAS